MSTPAKARLAEIINGFSSTSIAVVGDLILDTYADCNALGVANEAPVPLLEFKNETNSPGGAANVAANLAALGVTTSLVGPVGNDGEAEFLGRLLAEAGVRFCPVAIKGPTPHKTRFVAQGHFYLRLDEEQTTLLGEAEIVKLKALLESVSESASAIVVSDYDKGAITLPSAREIESTAKARSIPLFGDVKPQNAKFFEKLSLITPNLEEARQLFSQLNAGIAVPTDSAVAAMHLGQRLSCHVVLKMAEQGLVAVDSGSEIILFKALCPNPVNVSGAGDTVVATLSAALATGAPLNEAACLANIAASVAVAREGTYAVSAAELLIAVQAG